MGSLQRTGRASRSSRFQSASGARPAADCGRSKREKLGLDQTHTNAHARKRRVGYDGRPPTSRFKRVCWVEKRGKWYARIQKEGQNRRLGSFDGEIAAAQAYDGGCPRTVRRTRAAELPQWRGRVSRGGSCQICGGTAYRHRTPARRRVSWWR
jgi:hypothetical protein